MLFHDRAAAGRLLALELQKLAPADPVVYALPRGGVAVGAEIAKALSAPLDLVFVRKIGVPQQPELAAGSIVDGDTPELIVNEEIVRAAGLRETQLERLAQAALKEIERRRALYLPGREPIAAHGKTAILVDDGVATGASMRAAIAGVRRRGPKRVIAAVPVAPPGTAELLAAAVDDFVCLSIPSQFAGVGAFFRDFHQLDDAEVIALLAEVRPAPAERAF